MASHSLQAVDCFRVFGMRGPFFGGTFRWQVFEQRGHAARLRFQFEAVPKAWVSSRLAAPDPMSKYYERWLPGSTNHNFNAHRIRALWELEAAAQRGTSLASRRALQLPKQLVRSHAWRGDDDTSLDSLGVFQYWRKLAAVWGVMAWVMSKSCALRNHLRSHWQRCARHLEGRDECRTTTLIGFSKTTVGH